MANEIVLLDIPSEKAGPISSNTWKVRYALNYKGLPFRTEWVEMPDIAAACKKFGVPPTNPHPGSEYTVPAIYDPSTGKSVAESLDIALYLDATYPDRPRLILPGTIGFQCVFTDAFYMKVYQSLLQWIVIRALDTWNAPTSAYLRRQHESMVLGATTEQSAKGWEETKKGLNWLAECLKENEKMGQTGPFVMGDVPCFADFVVAGGFTLLGKVYKEGWAQVRELNDGRWAKFMDALSDYEGGMGIGKA